MSKSKCIKITRSGPLEVKMLKKCTPLWREAHFKVKSVKNWRVRSTFGRSDAALRGRRNGFCTLPKVSKTWRFCSSFNYNHHYTALHYTTLHYTPLNYKYKYNYNYSYHYNCNYNYNYTSLHHTNYITLDYTPLHPTTLHYTQLHYTPLHLQLQRKLQLRLNLQYITATLHYTTLSTLHYTTLITLHHSTPHHTTLTTTTATATTKLPYTTLHLTTLHYPTVHYTAFITPPQMQLQLRYTNCTAPELQLHDTTTTTTAALHHTTSSSCGWGDRPGDHCNHCNNSQKHNSNHLFRPSVDSLCHPWFTTTNLSYRFPSLKLPPPPCAVLLVYGCCYTGKFMHEFRRRARISRCKRWASKHKTAISPQLLAIEAHFVQKGWPIASPRCNFISSFGDRHFVRGGCVSWTSIHAALPP